MYRRGVAVTAALVAIVFFSSPANAGSGSDSRECRSRFSERQSVVEKDDNGECPLKQAFHNASLQLSGDELVQFQELQEELDATVLGNASMSADEQIAFCGYKLKFFFKKFKSIALKIQFFSISGFGSINDFISVADQVDGQSTEQLTVVEDGECEVVKAIKGRCGKAKDAAELNQCQWLVSQINTVVSGSYEYQYRMVLIEKVFTQFVVQYSESAWESFADIEISGSFGVLGQFRGVCKQFYRFANINNLFMGGDNCAFIKGIQASIDDTTNDWSRAERTQLGDFISNVKIFINDASMSDFARMRKCVQSFSEFMKTFEFMQARMCISIDIGAEFNFGSFGDFLGCFSFMSVDQQGVTGVPGAPVSGATEAPGSFSEGFSEGEGVSGGFTIIGGASEGFSEGFSEGESVSSGFTIIGGASEGFSEGFSEGESVSSGFTIIGGASEGFSEGFSEGEGVSGGFTEIGGISGASEGFTAIEVTGGVSEGQGHSGATEIPSGSVSPGGEVSAGTPKPGSPSEEAHGRLEGVFGLIDCSQGGAEFTVLVKSLVEMSKSLSGVDQTDFLGMVYDVRDHIICNASLTEEEMIVRASYEIKGFCGKRISIKKIVQYMAIGSWGMLNDFFNIAVTINGQSCHSVIVMSGGKCEFTDALESFAVTLSGEERTDCEALVSDCKGIFGSSSFSFSQMMIEVQIKFKAFFKKHSSLKAKCKSIEIGAWGTFEMFDDVSMAWYRFSEFETCFSIRGGESECAMVNDMNADCSNASYGLTRAEQTSTLDFTSKCQAPSQDVSLNKMGKAKKIVYEFKQYMLISKWLFAIIREFEMVGEVEFGCFGDFLDCYDIMVILNGAATDVPSLPPTTSVAPTTPTTTIAPTTTPVTGDCGSAGSLFKLNNNHSIVVDSLYSGCSGFNGTQCTNFKPYIMKIDNGVVRNSTLTSDSQRLSFFSYIVTQYCGTNALRLYFVMNVKMSNGWGNVQQLCNCDKK